MTKDPGFSVDGMLAYLVANGSMSAEGAQRVKAVIKATNQAVDIVITELGLMKEDAFLKQSSDFLGLPLLEDFDADHLASLVKTIGIDFATDNAIFPIARDDDGLTLATANPFDLDAFAATRYFFDCPVQTVLASRAKLKELEEVARLHLTRHDADPSVGGEAEEAHSDDLERLQDIALSAPVVSLVNRIIQRALEENATDIHIEPLEERVQIRFRRDGILRVAETAPKLMHAGIVSRIKILSRLNIVERRLPQDGRMRLSIRGEEIDFRVSVVPSAHGETLALRLLRKNGVSLELASLGYDEPSRRQIESFAKMSNGVFVITGPTGSGKTTTLYALVSLINRPDIKIFTVEDPVEYRIEGITQLQVEAALGLDFATALRSILRQDPDVILVGEIRDQETAQIAMRAALTGHLVLTTLHTNSAAGALTRLIDMGIEPYLIGATVRGVLAQRLVRTYCTSCRGTEPQPTCPDCRGSGYSGRTVIHELLTVDETVASMVTSEATEAEIAASCKRAGFVTLAECGKSLVEKGKTSIEELARVLGSGVSS
ncbi:GspE/PulE family protein [Rhizobium alvei]|uniref:GspE/PulE family protein n=1 Tax=Rhizobium alvei TaxID=1132659 RepID=A0ABT8YPF6_9HYPH|nr:GspE/PulE family protein [Rhizobium alvei]MDO6965243.1 GspE/PulE family protein [Rhizobium alvei]